MEQLWPIFLTVFTVYLVSALLEGAHVWYTLSAWSKAYARKTALPWLAGEHILALNECPRAGRRPSEPPTKAMAVQAYVWSLCPVLNTAFVMAMCVVLPLRGLPVLGITLVFGSKGEYEKWRAQPWGFKAPTR